MPAKVKVKIIAGKNLPVMDRSSDTTDAYVEIKLGGTTFKTEVCRKSLNPQWNSDWYRFEMDDSELQDEPLQIRLMDHDTYSANDAIGKVYVDLNPLLLPIAIVSKCGWSGEPSNNGEHCTNSLLFGWFPVYDTMHGIRGEVNIMVKVELFSDFNKFRQSSCGVQFFCSPSVPHGYSIQMYHGFVEELIVNDDPEYQWIDKIRTPRASNEARQTLFFKLAGELRRKIGVKALELGGNAVIGYSQCFDLEGELGVVVRGIGTSVTLTRLRDIPPLTITESNNDEHALKNLQSPRCDKGFHLNHSYLNNNINNNNSTFSPTSHSEITYPSAKQKKTLSRHLSYNEFTTMRSTLSLNQSVISNTKNHSSSLQTLLRQEDLRGVPSNTITQTFKNLKHSSHNLLSKKMTALKAKLSDSEMREENHVGENNQSVKKRDILFHSKSNESNPIAELLVHSIMHSSINQIANEGDSSGSEQIYLNNDSSLSSSSTDGDDTASSNADYDTLSNISNSLSSAPNANVDEIPDVGCIQQEKLAPLAATEFFDVEDGDRCYFTIGNEGNDSESADSHSLDKSAVSESIIPSVEMSDGAIEHKSLTETAMTVLLLDKIKLMGTYTPPSSPKCVNKKIKFKAGLSSHIPSDHLFKLPVNVELDKGNNNMHASLGHSPRTIISPGTELYKCEPGHHRTESASGKVSQSPGRFQSIPFINRRSSDSDLSITPKGNSLTGSDKSSGLHNAYISRAGQMLHTNIPQNNFEMLEYPFMTIYRFPPGYVLYLGGVVSARSVKLLERITNLEEPESRDTWWTELRMEIRSHMRSLHCNAVLAYSETSSISDDVCVLSASGTAAVIRCNWTEEIGDSLTSSHSASRQTSTNKDVMASSLERNDFERERLLHKPDLGINSRPLAESPENDNALNFNTVSPCTICHLPYNNSSVPLRTISSKCAFCRFGKVPEVLMATIEIPDSIPTVGRGCFVQAYVCRPLKDLRSELNAKDISDGLPFLEYELHRILVNKIRIKGMNAVFGLRIRISVGTKMLVGIATGTAVFLLPLPSPPLPKLVSIGVIDDKQLIKMQQHLHDTIQANKEIYHLKENTTNSRLSPDDEHPQEEEQSFPDFSLENRDCCILEVDDLEDKEIMELLREPPPPDGFHVINTEVIPGLEEMEVIKNLQMFTQIWRSKIYPSYNFGLHISKLLQSVYFKLRQMVPCALCNLKFRIDLPEPDEIQLTVLGMALELRKSIKHKKKQIHTSLKESVPKTTEEDMMFNLEEDSLDNNTLTVQTGRNRTRSPFRTASNVVLQHPEKHSIDITQLSYIPGAKIEKYLGNLNFFFIRETTSIREEGGLSGFIHTFVTEVLAIVRAHIAALGGNAMVAYYMTDCVVSHSVHKNQGQCLINVGGDVVFVSSYSEE